MAAYKLLLLVAIAATGLQLSVCDEKPEVTKRVQTTVKPVIENIKSKPQAPAKPVIENIKSKPQAPAKQVIKNTEPKPQAPAKPVIENIEFKPQAPAKQVIENTESKPQAPAKQVIENTEPKPQAPAKPVIENIESKPQAPAKPVIENIEFKPQAPAKQVIENTESKPQAPAKQVIENIETASQTTAKPEIENAETASQTTAKPEIENAETEAHALERKIFQNIDAKWLAIVYKKKTVFECDCSQSNVANGLEHLAHGILISPNSVAIPIVKKLPKKSDLVIRVYDMKLNSTITRSTPYQEREVILVHRSIRNTKAAHFELLGFKDPIENVVSPKNYGIKSDHCYQLYLNKISNDYVFRALEVGDRASYESDINIFIELMYNKHLYVGAIKTVGPVNVTEAVRDLPYGSPLVCYDVQHSTTSVIGVNVELKEFAGADTIYYYMQTNGVFPL
ncbi:DNA translocase FtsK 1 isoform X2 [Microplitis demolitor]|uniref:DNA translocase FtsK 1 isoform X2 n=1 Tax=Microplitis demolitor TaxID=69319 RepID=UPI00235B65DB|nr:DNA translocase FtsK 1 isoform X2 [Microplitis demolitor]